MNTAIEMRGDIATVTLSRGKVNAINGEVVTDLAQALESLRVNPQVRAIILTGSGKFFSFGFDVPEFLSFTREQFTDFVSAFAALYTYVFRYPKPVVAALNGHTIAGGCMVALACDHRVMVTGKARISLNEITFGASVFAGSVEMLRFSVGSAKAMRILYSGARFSAEEAVALGLVHEAAAEGELMSVATTAALQLASQPARAFASVKSLLRGPIADQMVAREPDSIREFVDIWYSEDTWARLRNIVIH
jgi:Delta3-Delta2-enoyl-CoA isomerase